MFCKNCGNNLDDENAKFCDKCGFRISNDVVGEDKIKTISENKEIKETSLNPTTQGKRLINLLMDWAGIYLFSLASGYILGYTGLYYSLGLEGMNETLLGAIFSVLYYIIMESIWSKTLGKFVTKTRVVMNDGSKPEFIDILKRSFTRIVPFEAFTFLGENRPIGLHDRWSKTIVVDEK